MFWHALILHVCMIWPHADQHCVSVLQRAMFLADRGMTIDLSARMNAVRVDPVRQEVMVQGKL